MESSDDAISAVKSALTLSFSSEAIDRYRTLATKAQEGSLTADEEAELDSMLTLNASLTVLQSKARTFLKHGLMD